MATKDEFEGLREDYRGGRYVWPKNEWKRPSLIDLAKWKFEYPDYSNVPKVDKELDEVLPITPVDKDKLNQPPENGIQVMWIGHASVLVQFDGMTILADPVFSDVCGPLNQWFKGRMFGYKRYRPASCKVRDLPEVDAVIISHNHYDHLDKPSVEALNRRFPDLNWYVGRGLKPWFGSLGCQKVDEMTWWADMSYCSGSKQFQFICTPAQHWCGRGPTDENKCLWCSWIVKGPSGKKFFFAGDTGYHEKLFQKIGEKYGPFDLAALPIGAYKPRKIVQYQHVNPQEAVNIHADIVSEWSVGIHWGTFLLTNEFYVEPPQKVEEEMRNKQRETNENDQEKNARLDPERFQCLNHGEIWTVGTGRDRPSFMTVPNPTPEDARL